MLARQSHNPAGLPSFLLQFLSVVSFRFPAAFVQLSAHQLSSLARVFPCSLCSALVRILLRRAEDNESVPFTNLGEARSPDHGMPLGLVIVLFVNRVARKYQLGENWELTKGGRDKKKR